MTLDLNRDRLADGVLDAADAYRRMRTIRRFEEWVIDLHRAGEIAGSVHLCSGQEAVPVGACAALGPDDRVVATYRGHGWALALGTPPEQLFAELLGRVSGTNGGRAGSAYLTSPEHRFVGENSIVGAGLPIANGIALASKLDGGGGIALVDFGDGATNQGASHEALVFAVARALPVVFMCENNGWSEMTPISATVPVSLAERAAGYGLASCAVDGNVPAAVFAAVSAATERIAGGGGPSFIEAHTTRLGGHYQADVEQYRPDSDKQRAAELDPLSTSRFELDRDVREGIDAEIDVELEAAVAAARAAAVAGSSDSQLHIYAPPATARPVVDGAATQELTYAAAVNTALRRILTDSPEALVFGEDVAIPGGVFGVTRNLRRDFGEDRIFDTPISESAIIGAAVGAAMEGRRPIIEVMWADFLLVALDQLVNQAANVRYISQGRRGAPFVLRTQQGATPGSCAQHSQSIEALLAHIPGLRVGLPSTPQDAYQMTLAAHDCADPVVLIEARGLYQQKGVVEVGGAVEPLGQARIRREGSDVSIISWGAMANTCVAAAESLAAENINASVLDLRWLCPLDVDAIVASVAATSRVLVVHEANLTGGFGGEVVARVIEHAWDYLDAPPARLAAADTRMPSAPSLQAGMVPDVSAIQAAVRRLCAA